MTLGQAIDNAISQHSATYPGSGVYHASVGESSLRPDYWKVDIRAEHFSQTLVYYVQR